MHILQNTYPLATIRLFYIFLIFDSEHEGSLRILCRNLVILSNSILPLFIYNLGPNIDEKYFYIALYKHDYHYGIHLLG